MKDQDESRELTMLERWALDGQETGYMGGTSADQCNSCARRAANLDLWCEAFPEFNTIPTEILQNRFDHNYPHPKDNGIQRIHGQPAWDPGKPSPKAPWEE